MRSSFPGSSACAICLPYAENPEGARRAAGRGTTRSADRPCGVLRGPVVGCRVALTLAAGPDTGPSELRWLDCVVRTERSGDDGPDRVAYAIALDDSASTSVSSVTDRAHAMGPLRGRPAIRDNTDTTSGSSDARTKTRRPFVVRAGLAIAGVLVGLCIVELGLRVVGFEFHLAPEVVDFGAPSRAQISASFHVDEDLMWVPRDYDERLERYRTIRPQLVFMGDSCTQLGAYPRLVAQSVAWESPDTPLSFANLGVVGWTSYQGLRQMERDVPTLHPRVVTIYFGWNDHWIGYGVEDEQVGKIAAFARFGLADLRVSQLVAHVWIAADPGDSERPERVPEAAFAANLTAIVRTARANGIDPLLVTAPSAHEPGYVPPHLLERFLRNADDLIPLHRRYVEIVRAVAAEESVPLCDLAAHFDALDPRDRAVHFAPDGIHPNERGDRVIAREMAASLREHGLVARLYAE